MIGMRQLPIEVSGPRARRLPKLMSDDTVENERQRMIGILQCSQVLVDVLNAFRRGRMRGEIPIRRLHDQIDIERSRHHEKQAIDDDQENRQIVLSSNDASIRMAYATETGH